MGRARPGSLERMVGDDYYCLRCGRIIQSERATTCGECTRMINKFRHGTTYLVVSDPTGTYERLGHHKDPAFSETLRFGYWPEDMIVEVWHGSKPKYVARVEGPTCPPDMDRALRRQVLMRIKGVACKGDGVYLVPGGKR